MNIIEPPIIQFLGFQEIGAGHWILPHPFCSQVAVQDLRRWRSDCSSKRASVDPSVRKLMPCGFVSIVMEDTPWRTWQFKWRTMSQKKTCKALKDWAGKPGFIMVPHSLWGPVGHLDGRKTEPYNLHKVLCHVMCHVLCSKCVAYYWYYCAVYITVYMYIQLYIHTYSSDRYVYWPKRVILFLQHIS